MVSIDFSKQILDLSGVALQEGEKALTLGAVAASGLLAQFANEANLAVSTKLTRYQIALKVATGALQDLTAEEVTALKDVIGRAFNPLVVGRAFDILDPPPAPVVPQPQPAAAPVAAAAPAPVSVAS